MWEDNHLSCIGATGVGTCAIRGLVRGGEKMILTYNQHSNDFSFKFNEFELYSKDARDYLDGMSGLEYDEIKFLVSKYGMETLLAGLTIIIMKNKKVLHWFNSLSDAIYS